MMRNNRFRLGNLEIDALDKAGALHAIDNLILAGGGNVFTPNVDHVVLAECNQAFAKAYDRAAIALPDGMPIVWASWLSGANLTERVAGSSLLIPLIKFIWEHDLSLYLLGSNETVLKESIRKIDDMCPRIRILGSSSPLISNDVSDAEVSAIMEPIRALKPDVVIVAFGAPKQEIFIDKANAAGSQIVMLGLGASLDFLAGAAKRAPKLMQSIGLEWLWRLVHEPKRLWRRYLRDLQFPLIVFRQCFREFKH